MCIKAEKILVVHVTHKKVGLSRTKTAQSNAHAEIQIAHLPIPEDKKIKMRDLCSAISPPKQTQRLWGIQYI
jgi:hypothetical protein